MDSMEDDEASESELQPAVTEDDENAGKPEEEMTNMKSQSPEEGPVKAATEFTQASARNIERDVPKELQIEVTEVEEERTEERTKEHASPTTPRSKEELVLSKRPASG